MSKGVLIFAFNNDTFNYFKQANWVADRVTRFLNIPVTIVTDTNSAATTNHNVIITDAIQSGKRQYTEGMRDMWYNANRFQAYEITPYNETIIIDSDYIVNSDQLNLLFDSPHDFLCHRHAYDVADKNSLQALQTFGTVNFPQYWATVLFFRQTDFASTIFDLIAMVKENYKHYSKLYKFAARPFRNDYAVSIALSIAYGHRINAIPAIPWNLPTAISNIKVSQLNDVTFELAYDKWSRNKIRPMKSIVSGQDLHCLDKVSLEEIINAST